MKKKTFILVFTLILTCCVIFPPLSIDAANTPYPSIISIEKLGNGYYYETFIEFADMPTTDTHSTTQTITRTKTTRLKNNSSEVLWSVSVTATFTYDGITSECISCTPSATAYNSSWSIKEVTSHKINNTATATAVAIRTSLFLSDEVTKSVSLTCDQYGTVS